MKVSDLLIKSLECCVEAIRWDAEVNGISFGNKLFCSMHKDSNNATIVKVCDRYESLFEGTFNQRFLYRGIPKDTARPLLDSLTAIHKTLQGYADQGLVEKPLPIKDTGKEPVWSPEVWIGVENDTIWGNTYIPLTLAGIFKKG